MHDHNSYEHEIESRRGNSEMKGCAQFDVQVSKKNGEYMDHPDVHIKNEPKFVDHAHPYGMGMHGCGDGFGLGGGGIAGGLLLGALLGRGGLGGWGGGNGNGCSGERAVFDASILSKLGTIEGQVPLVGAQTQGLIATSTGLINNTSLQIALGQSQQATTLALGQQAQIAGVKDAVQTGVFATTQAVQADGNQTRALIQSLETANLNRQLGVLETTLLLERHNLARANDTHALTIQNVNTNTAVAMQQQQQQSFNSRLLDMLHSCDQTIRATNQAINIGSGTQVATPNNTSTNNRVN